VADNITVPWSVLPVAADDVGGILHQRVKLGLGVDGVAVDAPGDAAFGMDVDVKRVAGDVAVTIAQTVDVEIQGTPAVSISGTPDVAIPDIVIVDDVAVSSAVVARVEASATSVPLRASNVNRRGLTIYNDCDSPLLIKYGAGATPTSFTTRVPGFWTWEMPHRIYTGLVEGMWEEEVPDGAAQVTEI
jgi:hypothetical protein